MKLLNNPFIFPRFEFGERQKHVCHLSDKITAITALWWETEPCLSLRTCWSDIWIRYPSIKLVVFHCSYTHCGQSERTHLKSCHSDDAFTVLVSLCLCSVLAGLDFTSAVSSLLQSTLDKCVWGAGKGCALRLRGCNGQTSANAINRNLMTLTLSWNETNEI